MPLDPTPDPDPHPNPARSADPTIADRVGQAAEWLLWTTLTLTSPLHVFLPLRDMGVDGIARLPATDIAVALQIKSRHALDDGKLHLLVRDSELTDPRAVIVAVVLDPEQRRLHDTAICVDVPTFVALSFRRTGVDHGYQASIPFPPTPSSRWHPYAVALADLAARLIPAIADDAADRAPVSPGPVLLGPVSTEPPHLPPPPTPTDSHDLGYRAEARLVALLATDPRLNVFKAFPDLEMVEYCVRHVHTGGIAGIQVKAISVDGDHPRGAVNVPPHTYHATPMSWFVVLAEHRADRCLHDTCLLIPAMDIGDLLIDHAGERSLTWDPDSTRHDAAVAPYRLSTEALAAHLASSLE